MIAGIRYADDYEVIWCGMAISRVKFGSGSPHDKPPWTWTCHAHGRPQGSADCLTAVAHEDAKAKFKDARARMRASLYEGCPLAEVEADKP